MLRLAIPCPAIPDSLILEHVAGSSADPASWPEPDPRPDGLYRIQAGFWEAIRTAEFYDCTRSAGTSGWRGGSSIPRFGPTRPLPASPTAVPATAESERPGCSPAPTPQS